MIIERRKAADLLACRFRVWERLSWPVPLLSWLWSWSAQLWRSEGPNLPSTDRCSAPPPSSTAQTPDAPPASTSWRDRRWCCSPAAVATMHGFMKRFNITFYALDLIGVLYGVRQ